MLAEDWRGAMVEFNLALTTSSIVARKAEVEALGGFRPFRYVHDWDFMLRSLSRLSVEWLDEPLCDYRVHGANTIGEVRDGPGRALLIAEQSLMTEFFRDQATYGPQLFGMMNFVQRMAGVRTYNEALAFRADNAAW